MFLGHLPAGYVFTKLLQDKLDTKKYLGFGLFASVLPDIDIFYFYLIDGRENLHHGYWIHTPFWWLMVAIFVFTLIFLLKRNYAFAIIFFANIFLHLFLDTIVGKIEWFYPFTDKAYFFFEVPSIYNFWVYNFIFHWTFLFEIVLIFLALFIFVKNRKGVSTFVS